MRLCDICVKPPVYFVHVWGRQLSPTLIDVPVHKHLAVTQAPQWAA